MRRSLIFALVLSLLCVSLDAADFYQSDQKLSPIEFSRSRGKQEMPPFVFKETWGYIMDSRSYEFDIKTMKVTDACLFGASINSFGEVTGIPVRSKHIPKKYKGRVHLVCAVDSPSIAHFLLEPKYGLDRKAIEALVAGSSQYDGLQIDFESIKARDGDNFRNFLRNLKKALPKEKIFSVCVHARMSTLQSDAYDYAKISEIVDKVFVMAYDEHWATSKPGPVAGLGWSRRIAEYSLSVIPAEKFIMGLPFYGRTWQDVNYRTAWYESGINRICRENNVTEVSRTDYVPNFTFKTEITVTGWYDDEKSLTERCRMCRSLGISNIGFWRLGQENPGFWKNIEIAK